MVQRRITQPVYFRVVPGNDGQPTIEQIQFLTTESLALITGLEARTIRDWVKRDLLPFHKPPGTGHYLFELNETLRFLMSRKETDSE
jgi:excisionase family DNA binding protein